ncbi:hypothetical protein NITHO_3510009 [Nitrolancea hollandica Lb]|uniref:Uncharacterized protein n=1 Tax=Nitrolancea hollandica Lb TaxID=1129897 RepID=I4EIJ2_9BACT|nr:hypothetical protein NITHO_3510009 [Nitrolancea hollandica Lb]
MHQGQVWFILTIYWIERGINGNGPRRHCLG